MRNASLVFVAGAALAALPILAQNPASGPVARYDMRAGTVGGMGALAAAGMGSMMSMIFGGGGSKQQRELYLRLGSNRAAAPGAPKADHFMPSGAKLGKSVKLSTPVQESAPTDQIPMQRPGERPTGRILLYWGCGEHAPKGQPVIIDLARLSAGQVPPGLWSTTIVRDWGPSPTNSKTFGRWPAEDNKYVKSDSSLLGAHRVAGNYSPEIAFTLTKDFMPVLSTRLAVMPSGAAQLSWNALPEATGYIASLTGGKRGPGETMGDMVMWTSSASKQFGGGLSDWLSPAQVAGLVRDRTALAPSVTTCTIPAEVRRDTPDFRFGMLTGFGPEEYFSYPPRPAAANTPWHLEWTARIRHRSFTSWMDMPGMEAMNGEQPGKPECKRGGGLGGILGGVLKPGC